MQIIKPVRQTQARQKGDTWFIPYFKKIFYCNSNRSFFITSMQSKKRRRL